jgi:hypothetical protein
MPVIKCESNGKWRIGSGKCIYDTKEKATEVWTAIQAAGKYSYKKPNEKKTKTKRNG